MSRPTVAVIMMLNGAPVDVTPWVQMPAGITVTRGRNNEQASPDAGTLTFSLDNRDGRFTIGAATLADGATPNPLHPYFDKWVEVRYEVNGGRRFTGYISSAPTVWDRKSSALASVRVTCTDLLGMMAMSPVVGPWVDEIIGALGPAYWWKLDDPEGSTQAAEASSGMPLVGVQHGTDTTDGRLTFGVEGPAILESDTQLSWENNYDSGSSTLNGWSLESSGTMAGLTLGTTGITLLAIFTPPAAEKFSASDSRIFWFGSASDYVTVFRPNRTNKLTIAQSVSGVGGSVTTDALLSPGVPYLLAVTFTATTVTLLGTPYSFTPSGGTATLNGRPVKVNTAGTFSSWTSAGTLSHVAVINDTMSAPEYAALKAKLFGDGSAPVSDWLTRACRAAGISASVTATYDRSMDRPTLKGSNPAAAGESLAQSCGALFVASRDGEPRWLDPSYCPPRVDLDATRFSSDLSWSADSSLYYTDVQVDDVTRVSMAGFPRTARSVPGLLSDADLAGYLTWLENTADVWGAPRLAGISVNLMAMDVGTTATYLGLDLKSRIYPTGLPPQLPLAMVSTVEGYAETLTESEWTLDLTTAPDPRFVVGDSVAGVLGSGYRLATLPPHA